MRTLFALSATALVALPSPAQEPGGGSKVYKQAVPSVVWVHSTRDRGLATGSGTLIDHDRRLVLTNYHVVENNPKATAFFPELRDGLPVAERKFYTDRAARYAHRGRVVALDKQADLALIQLETVPDDAPGIPVASGSPGPGDGVHSIGNTGKSGALWGYVKGTVRQVYRKKWKARLDEKRVIAFEAKVIETDSATNPGDSGGPLLNDKGELVGVTQGGAVDAQLVSTFVDVSEVKQLLAREEVRRLKGDKQPPKRTTPVAVSDKAKLFSADAVKAAEGVVAELYKMKLDVLVETYPEAPAEWKAKAAKPEDRQQLFRDWAKKRLADEKANGVMVLVCHDPRFLHVEVEESVKAKFPEKFAQKVADALLKGLRTEKPDEGLADALKLIRDSYKGDKK